MILNCRGGFFENPVFASCRFDIMHLDGGTVAFGCSGPRRDIRPWCHRGSPLYQSMVDAARKVSNELPSVTVKVVEGGFNQADGPRK